MDLHGGTAASGEAAPIVVQAPAGQSVQRALPQSVALRSAPGGWKARRLAVDCLGLAPFVLFCVMAELLPIWTIVHLGLVDAGGGLTLQHFQDALAPVYQHAFVNSIVISLATAAASALLGPPMIYAAMRLSRRAAGAMNGLSAVAANFAGVPLAFTFIATLGVQGLLTSFLQQHFGLDIYSAGFSLYSTFGLGLCYFYFQLPLMILLIGPALAGLRPEWRQASATLGAPTWRYWWHVGIPVLAPTVLAAAALLFANAFGAYGTAFALSPSTLNLVSVKLGYFINGDVGADFAAGGALATLMILVMLVCIILYQALKSRGQRWVA